jgi:hypothetical protein
MARRWAAARRARRLVTVLTSAGVTMLSGCGEHPTSADFSALYFLSSGSGSTGMRAWTVYGRDTDLPEDLDEVAKLTIAGVSQPLEGGGNSDAPGYIAESMVPFLAPGESYDIVLDLPWQQGISVSVPMVHPAALAVPASGASLDVSEDLEVAWSTEPTDDTEAVYLAIPGVSAGPMAGTMYGGSHGYAHVTAIVGDDEMLIPAEEVQHWLRDVASELACRHPPEELAFPVDAQVRLYRTRSVSNAPPFAAGGYADVAVETSSVDVTLVDPGASVTDTRCAP